MSHVDEDLATRTSVMCTEQCPCLVNPTQAELWSQSVLQTASFVPTDGVTLWTECEELIADPDTEKTSSVELAL